MILPCIDLMSGKVVQLVRGEKKALEISDVMSLVEKFSVFPEIQVIDLDAAKGIGDNTGLIKKICYLTVCRVGGGIRTVEKAKEVMQMGAKKVILGSSVFIDGGINFDFLTQLKKEIPKKEIIIAIDSKKGNIVTKGWKHDTGIKTEDAIKKLEPYCGEFLYTYVDKEGMMEGTNLGIFKDLRELTKNSITAAGGISSINEIRELEKMKINSALGMSLYTGKINFQDLVELNNELRLK